MRAAAYLRVSTDEQALNGISLTVQEKSIRALCLAKRWHLKSVIRDEASGKNLDRPGMKRLQDIIQRRKVDVIVIYKLDRLSRALFDLLDLLKMIQKARVEFASVTESFDTTSAMGRAFLQIAGVFSELERGMIAERTTAALRERRSRLEVYGRTPYGFLRVDKRLVPHEDELQVVREMRIWRDDEASFHSIARRLNERHVPTKHGKGQWHGPMVRYILRNPIYEQVKEG